MKILVVKMSSLGDLIHTLPAITDATTCVKNLQIDWVAEESLAEIPTWHSKINQVIPISLRRWKKDWKIFRKEWKIFKEKLQAEKYDVIIDAQGLLKSAMVSLFAKGKRIGLDFSSATESLASFFYQKKVHIDLQAQAVFRMRSIFAQSLNYNFEALPLDYGLKKPENPNLKEPYVFFAHGTTWPSKRWPLKHWIALANLITEKGIHIYLPWGNTLEKDEANAIAKNHSNITVLPKQNLTQLSRIIAHAKAVVSVDTGLAHLAAAFGIPNVVLYGPTSPNRTGAVGKNQIHVQPDFDCLFCDKPICYYHGKRNITPQCMQTIKPEEVLKECLEK